MQIKNQDATTFKYFQIWTAMHSCHREFEYFYLKRKKYT